jgi:hypothetical protein
VRYPYLEPDGAFLLLIRDHDFHYLLEIGVLMVWREHDRDIVRAAQRDDTLWTPPLVRHFQVFQLLCSTLYALQSTQRFRPDHFRGAAKEYGEQTNLGGLGVKGREHAHVRVWLAAGEDKPVGEREG